jgi:integrase/recombinase XerD
VMTPFSLMMRFPVSKRKPLHWRPTMKLAQVVEGFFIVRRTRLAATTIINYRYCFDKLLAYFGPGTPFAKIAPEDIRRFADHLRGTGLSERSIHDNLVICSSLWTFAAGEFGFAHVVKGIEKPKYDDKLIVPFTIEETKALVTAAEWTSNWNTRTGKQARSKRPTARRDVAIILTLLDTGLRVSELCNLTVRDYQTETGRLHVRHGKGNKARHVFAGVRAQKAIWRYLLERNRVRPADPLFASKTENALERNNIRHTLNQIGENAGVDDVHPHRFRHTFAVEFLRNGGNVFELKRILGHEKLATVEVYLELASVDIQKAQHANSPADNWRL